MKFLILITLLLSTKGHAATFDLNTFDQKNIQIGFLSQGQNQAVSDVIIFKRTAKTPAKVEVNYSFNYVARECVDYKIESKWIPDLSKVVCKKSGGGTHDCETRDFEGFFENERKCIKKGLVLKTKNEKVTFNFKKAVQLAGEIEEIFTLSITQKKMKNSLVKIELSSVESAGIYKFSKLGKSYFFKLK